MRGDAPLYPFRPFALFVILFPHLIAGPIVRHNELVPQFAEDPRRSGLWQRIGTGLVLFTLGFAKKVLLADKLAEVVDPLFLRAKTEMLTFGDAWTAALAFSFQLFLDFSAYTEMAIGIALMFGLLLPENFRRPYLATDLRDFWRRWHISLSNFLRDYLYIPLGGSRHGVARYLWASMATMGLCGLWHGAGWTYVVWGLWHGAGLVIVPWLAAFRTADAGLGWLVHHDAVRAGRLGDFSRQRFSPTANSILYAMSGAAGLSGTLKQPGLLLAAAAVSALLPSAHEIRARRPILHPARGGRVCSAGRILRA